MSGRAHACGGGPTKQAARRRRRNRRHGHEHREPAVDAEYDPADPIARGRRRGKAKAKLAKDLMGLLLATAIVGVFAGAAARWVILIGGFILLGDYLKKVLEPQLRERWIEREVRRELDHEVAAHRHQTQGEHVRHIEHLAAGVAHEIRNPITAAKSLVQQMGEDPGSHENVEYAHVALEELERVEKSISHLLRFAREEGFQAEPLELREVVRGALETFRERIDRERVEVRLRTDGAPEIQGDPEKLRRVVINLIGNGLDAMRDAKRPVLEIECGENLAGTEAWLRVRDHGHGIPETQRADIWSPFYSSKDEGTGLGLALTKKIIEAHGGRIELESPSDGAAFLVTLPTPAAPAQELT